MPNTWLDEAHCLCARFELFVNVYGETLIKLTSSISPQRTQVFAPFTDIGLPETHAASKIDICVFPDVEFSSLMAHAVDVAQSGREAC